MEVIIIIIIIIIIITINVAIYNNNNNNNNESARDLLSDVGRRISMSSGDDREVHFLFQRVSVVVQRFNCVMLHDSFCVEDQPD